MVVGQIIQLLCDQCGVTTVYCNVLHSRQQSVGTSSLSYSVTCYHVSQPVCLWQNIVALAFLSVAVTVENYIHVRLYVLLVYR